MLSSSHVCLARQLQLFCEIQNFVGRVMLTLLICLKNNMPALRCRDPLELLPEGKLRERLSTHSLFCDGG